MDRSHRPPPDARSGRMPGDVWVDCACGNWHWGGNGAAGLMLWRRSAEGDRAETVGIAEAEGAEGAGAEGVEVLLQHRALWSHHGGTWGLPGGALADGETPVDGALREAGEEGGIPPEAVRVRAARVLAHPDWSYTTVVAEAVAPFELRDDDAETLAMRWVPLGALVGYELLPAFADTLGELRTMLRSLVLVVDAANVVGSRPDGWWNDRRGATVRLRDHLATLPHTGIDAAAVRLPGRLWYPQIVLVTEGKARGVEAADAVRVVSAATSGDDAIVETTRDLLGGQAEGLIGEHATPEVAVVTADRGLIARVSALGARTLGPRTVLAPARDRRP